MPSHLFRSSSLYVVHAPTHTAAPSSKMDLKIKARVFNGASAYITMTYHWGAVGEDDYKSLYQSPSGVICFTLLLASIMK
jgi:hypothetical protein